MLRYPLTSRRACRLRGSHGDYLILSESELSLDEANMSRVPAQFVLADLDLWLASPFTARPLCELCEAVTGRNLFNPLTLEPSQEPWLIRDCLSQALDSGRLVALSTPLLDPGQPAHHDSVKRPRLPVSTISSLTKADKQKMRSALVKKIRLVAPTRKAAGRAMACCGWAAFQVELYDPPASAEERKNTKWLIKDASTNATLENPGKAEGASLKIDPIPDDWRGRTINVHAYCQAPSDDVKVSLTIQPCGQVGEFIGLVRKVEAAHPGWSGERVLNSIRRLAGYDGKKFRDMYGGLAVADTLAPSGELTQAALDALQRMTRHKLEGDVELGIATDSFGEPVALGHVLTGISAGQHRHRSIDLTPSWSLGAGELMDNLYATTIAGDLGQMAVYVSHRQATSYIGPGTDATDAELIGDIDGFLIGSNLARYTQGKSLLTAGASGARLSDLLHEYYCVFERSEAPPNTAADRFQQFSTQSRDVLLDQTKRFATNYAYASEGKWKGMWSDADEADSEKAVDAFWDWLLGKKEEETR